MAEGRYGPDEVLGKQLLRDYYGDNWMVPTQKDNAHMFQGAQRRQWKQ